MKAIEAKEKCLMVRNTTVSRLDLIREKIKNSADGGFNTVFIGEFFISNEDKEFGK